MEKIENNSSMTKPDYNQESRNLKLAVLAERDNVKELLDFFEYCLDDPDGSQRTYLGPRGIVCRFKIIQLTGSTLQVRTNRRFL